MAIHACGQVFFDLMREGIGRQRHDGRPRTPTFQLSGANCAGGVDSVHDRHLDVHEDQVEGSVPPSLKGLTTVSNDFHLDAE